MNRKKRFYLYFSLVFVIFVFFLYKILIGSLTGGNNKFKYLPWVDCDFQTPKFGCFYSSG